MAIDPRGADLKRLLAEDPGGPVVMLNLLTVAALIPWPLLTGSPRSGAFRLL